MTTVTMPQLGESVTEGTILQWLKQPGEPVALDDALCEIETEKVTAELPSPYAGVMGDQLAQQGDVVQVGEPLCEVVEEGIAAQPAPKEPASSSSRVAAANGSAPPPPARGVSLPSSTATPAHSPEPRARFYSPAVLRLAREHDIDLETLTGSGVGGRVTRKDVERSLTAQQPSISEKQAAPSAAETTQPAGRFHRIELSPTRRTIAENMRKSNVEAPQAWTMIEADVSALIALRDREREAFKAQEGVSLTLLPYFVQAVCEALREHPALNAHWEDGELRQYDDLDIGIAVASPSGLVVPVIHGADQLSVRGLALRIADLAERARAKRLQLADIEGGTFTVNNTGAFGSIASRPIVNVPQVAIVTMERAIRRPVAIDDSTIGLRWMMNICLSFDHRAMDGSEAGAFLAALKARLEAPDHG